ncbi:Mce-associated membrane protein [Pseudonocardia ammonioxydans]|uniref:Mce-associated membrane protein n=1 Tax=Pseudonocardia ammonioxydans TaxID=260086 RepID=A0A1I5HCY7_PSUAM|nr:Mce-associated membrane protein [Pseudonocardia ammonioxydans]
MGRTHAQGPGGDGRSADAGDRPGVGSRIVAVLTAPLRGFRRRLEHRPRRVLTELAVAVVVCALLAGGLWGFSAMSASSAAGRADAVAAAQRTTTALLSYDPQGVNGLVDRVSGDLTEAFRTDYGTLISQVIAPATEQQQVTTEAEVVGTSVIPEETGGDRLVALLFVNQTTRAGQEGAPRIAGSRVKVTMDDVDGHWLVADVKPV